MFQIHPVLVQLMFAVAAIYCLVTVIQIILSQTDRKPYAGLVLGVVVLALVQFGLRPFSGLQSFGPSPLVLVCLMFVSVALGAVAEYFFTLKGQVIFIDVLKPVLIAPILLLPLIALVEENSNPGALSIVSILLVSFQNGFFWRDMIKKLRGSI